MGYLIKIHFCDSGNLIAFSCINFFTYLYMSKMLLFGYFYVKIQSDSALKDTYQSFGVSCANP